MLYTYFTNPFFPAEYPGLIIKLPLKAKITCTKTKVNCITKKTRVVVLSE